MLFVIIWLLKKDVKPMPTKNIFQTRINYTGEIKSFLIEVCLAYNLGNYKLHKIITVGYEDLNIILTTSLGRYLIKALASFRDKDNRLRYAEIIQEVNNAGIAHPKLYKSNQGILHTVLLDHEAVHLFVMEFIDGISFYELGTKPSKEEIKFLSRQAARISKINLKPKYVYDEWAITNFANEYNKVKKYISNQDIELIEPLAQEFSKLDINSLPHCFVHGDIIDTNVIKDHKNNLWILDFSVSNLYPRIQELAVISCSLLFDPAQKDRFIDNYLFALNEYQSEISLTQIEINTLPLFVKVAHAMHIIGATKTRIASKDSAENQYWMNFSRDGLSFVSKIWR